MKVFDFGNMILTPEYYKENNVEIDGVNFKIKPTVKFSIIQQLFIANVVRKMLCSKNAIVLSYAIHNFIEYCLDNDIKNFNDKYLTEKYGKVGNFMVRWYLFHAKRIKKMYIENTIITK